MGRLRFALADGTTAERWQARCLELLDEVAERVDGAAEPLDFVLQLGRSAPSTLAARHGVWRLEQVRDGDVVHAALLAGDAALEQGVFRVDPRLATQERVLDALAEWPARVCRRILAGVQPEPSPWSPPVAKNRSRSLLRARLGVAWERLFRHPQWNVGVLRASPAELVAGTFEDDVEWFRLAGRGSFLADPFGVERDGALHVLCEEFPYRDSTGRICTLTWPGPDVAQTLPLDGHVSYPFLLEEDGEIFCIPETCSANEVALYRATDFPRAWEKAGVLLGGFPGLDSTVFRHDGRWWLTCTRGGAYENEELYLWHAEELTGPWVEHARNPVKTDVRSARPGGRPFVVDGELYRPAQDCSKRYGWRVSIQRVTRLTPTDFAEEPASLVEASPGSPFPDGRHTVTPVGDLVLVDGLRRVFVWPALLAFLRVLARR